MTSPASSNIVSSSVNISPWRDVDDNIVIATGSVHTSNLLNGLPTLEVEHLHSHTVMQLHVGVNEIPGVR